MARPIKSGADYFPLDVNLDDDIKLLEAEYGLKGFAVLIKLYQKIYSCGYYCSFTSDVGLLFAKHNAASVDFVNEIIACCIRRNIFDKALYDKYSVLTSKGIQERYLEIKKRATNIILDKRYLLLSDTILSKYATITIVNVDNNSFNASNNTQSKVNESKEKKNPQSTPKEQTTFHNDSNEMKLAHYMYKKILKNCPNAKKPNFQSWAKTFNLMLNKDKLLYDDVNEMIGFAAWHPFWKSNILSPNKLRDKWATLYIQREERRKK